MNYFNTKNKPVIRANFSEDLSASFAPFMLKKSTENAPAVSVGVVWNAKEIKLVLISENALSYTVSIEKYNTTVSALTNKTTLLIKAEDTGLSLCDADILLPISIKADGRYASSSFIGFMRLCEYSPFFVIDEVRKNELLSSMSRAALANKDVDVATLDLGVEFNNGSLRFFDKHRDEEENYPYTNVTLSSTSLEDLERDIPISFDMDVSVKSFPAMDYHTVCTADSAYGLMFILSYGEGDDSLFFGIQNSPLGLYAFVNVGYTLKAQIPKSIGDTFNFSAKWTPSNTLALFIDGIEIMSFPVPKMIRASAKTRGLTIKWVRCRQKPKSHADDLDVALHNFTVSNDHTQSASSKFGIYDIMNEENIENVGFDGVYKAPEKLSLASSIQNEHLPIEMPLIWESSDCSVLSNDGLFFAPEGSGKMVNITAYGMSGEYAVFKKDFTFFAKGKSFNKKFLRRFATKILM